MRRLIRYRPYGPGHVRSSAWLEWRDPSEADLTGADLVGADLRGADLRWTDLTGADLAGTCLDPGAAIPPQDLSGWEVLPDGRLLGWRTRRSMHAGNTIYEHGVHYEAPWFSVDETTECHPGLYAFPRRGDAEGWARIYPYGLPRGPHPSVVQVAIEPADILRAGDKWRCRRFEVLLDHARELTR